jgi:malate dehydrogenase
MEVAIIGAGALGGAVAHALAQRDVARVIRIIDPSGTVGVGKALDILQSSAIDGFATRVVGANDVSAAAGAKVVVLADAAAGGELQGESGLALVRQLLGAGTPTSLVCAGASQRWLVDRAVRELGVPRHRAVGSAPAALASALRALLALHAGTSPAEVSLSVSGLPPAHLVVSWTHATIGARPVSEILSANELAKFEARARHLWPPGPYALAAAATGIVQGFLSGSCRTWSCFMALHDELGGRGGTIAVPVRFDRSQLPRVEVPVLSTHERVQLESARAASVI